MAGLQGFMTNQGKLNLSHDMISMALIGSGKSPVATVVKFRKKAEYSLILGTPTKTLSFFRILI